MKKISKAIFWFPRLLAIFFILFLSLFALDVFVPAEPVLNTLIGLLIHLIPNFILIIVLVVSWKKELIGGFFFLIMGFLLAAISSFEYFWIISFPVISIGILFIVNSYLTRNTKKLYEKE